MGPNRPVEKSLSVSKWPSHQKYISYKCVSTQVETQIVCSSLKMVFSSCPHTSRGRVAGHSCVVCGKAGPQLHHLGHLTSGQVLKLNTVTLEYCSDWSAWDSAGVGLRIRKCNLCGPGGACFGDPGQVRFALGLPSLCPFSPEQTPVGQTVCQ